MQSLFSTPSYLSELLHLDSLSHSLRSSSEHALTACSNSNASTTKPIAFALPHTLDPTSRTISPKIPGTLLLFLPSTANSRHFSSQNISVKQHCPSPLSVCTVCVCACMRVCEHACMRVCILHIVMLQHLLMSTLNNIVQPKKRSYFASHLFFFFLFFTIYLLFKCGFVA